MEIFLDSVNLSEIKKYMNYGIIDGVTTNPSLMAGSVTNFHTTVSSICDLIKGDVSIEVVANDYTNMVEEGNKIRAIAGNIVIKLPVTWDGIKACRYFSDKGTKVNMTLCFSATQALLAAKAGATYISPFIGRLEDIGQDGMELISDIRNIYDNYNIPTKILAASVRTTQHVTDAALYGADVVTLPSSILSVLLDHHLTETGLKKFNLDWAQSGMEI